MKSHSAKVSTKTLIISAMLLLLCMTSHAQFQKLYGLNGANTDEYFHRVIPYSQGFYLTGVENNVAYVSHTDLNGNWDWTSRLNMPSLLTDAKVIPGTDDLLFIGLTLTGSSNQSIIGQIDRFGLIGCLNILESPGSEGLIRMDANPSGSYTVVGFQTDPITLQDVVILDISPNCVINSKRIFLSSAFDEFANDVEVIGTDFYVAGIIGSAATIYRTSLAGTFVGGVQNPVQYNYSDIEEASGDLLAIANPTGAGQPQIMRYDSDLLVLWEISIFGVSRLDHIVENNGDIYVVGTATVAGLSRSVIFRIDDSSGPQIVWAKYIDDSETSFAGGSLAILSGGDIAYVDAREHLSGFGDYDAFFALTDEDLTTTCTQELTLDFSPEFTLFDSPAEIDLEFYDVPPFMGGDAVSLEWDQLSICASDSCQAAFTFTIVDDCGTVAFTDQSFGTPALQYCWDFDGNLTTCESILPNPTWQFPGPPCQSWLVCLTITAADGCTDTYCNSFTIFDNIPPVINCPPDLTLACDDDVSPIATGFANALDNCTLSPTIVYSDVLFGNIPCDGFIEREWTATDDCGNSSTCIQIIMIIDNIPPLLSNCPPDMTINVSGNPLPCQSNVTIPIPGATDYCSLPVTLINDYDGDPDASGLYPVGTTTVTWTATDDCGNTATCSMNVTVNCESMPAQLNLSCGMAVVTCFPGFIIPSDPNSNINNTAPVIAIMDVRNTSGATPGPGYNWTVPKEMFAQGNAQNIGQVFGLAIDNLGRIYTTASTIYGSAANLGGFGFQWGAAGPGGIYRFTYNAGLGQWQMDVFASLPNTGSGLGNIAYDPTKDQFFVTNHSDGLIYRIQNSPSGPGTIYSNKYDFQGTSHFPGSAGFVALGERLWGIGYHGGRVYFSVWNEDNFRKLTGVSNQIYSIGLDLTGEFKANTDQIPEVSLPNYFGDIYSNPVSDIEFSEAGSMIVAEKVMLGDFGDVASSSPGSLAHRARVFQYSRVGLTWGSPMHIQIGNAQVNPPTQHNNSAGGVDYGYQDLDNFGGLVGCDSLIWGTGDALMFTGHNQYASNNDRVYGIGGMPSRGNTANTSGPDWVESSSFYVDLDGNLGSEEKTEVGDVDVWNCICPGTNPFCDSIEVTSTPSTIPNDTCCFVLEVNNQLNNFFTGITLCTSNGVSISSISTLNGWNVVGYNSQQVTVQPSTQYVSTTSHDFIRFCLSNYQAVSNQQVIVKYHGPNFSVECMDTLNYQCSEKPKCIKIVNDTVTCADNGTYEMDFCIMSDALIGWPVSAIQLNAPGITFTPSVFSVVPALTPGGMRCTFTTQISGAQDGQTICFSVTAHKQNIAIGEIPLDCCTDTVMQACVTMPTCKCNNVFATYTSGMCGADTCCWNVTLTNNYSNTYFTGVNLDILTPGVVFGAICNTLGSGWGLNSGSTDATFTKLPSGSYLGSSETLPTFCLAGITSASQVPQEVALYWLGPNGDTACVDTLLFYCEPPVESDCAVIVNPKITCDSITGGYLFEFQVQNNSGFTVDQVSLNLIQPLGSIFPDQFTLTPPLPHTNTSPVLSTTMYGTAGSQICFNLTVHDLGPNGLELNCCTRSQQYCYILPPCDTCYCKDPSFTDLILHWNNGPGLSINCETSYEGIPCPEQGNGYFISGKFECVGDSCPISPFVHWELTGPSGNHFGTVNLNTYFSIGLLPSQTSQNGIYTMSLTSFCGTDTCKCEFQFVVECDTLCPCDAETIHALSLAVNQGFATIASSTGCTVCFAPVALSDCETVDWHLNNPNGPLLGSSIGNQTFCHSFPGPGTYTVVMVVTRLKPDGTLCESFAKYKTVTVTCVVNPACDGSVLRNSSFSDGAIPGGFNSGGASEGWTSILKDVEVVEGQPGSLDNWTIKLHGNLDTAGVLTSIDPICLARDTGVITFRVMTDPIPGIPGSLDPPVGRGKPRQLAIQAYQGNTFQVRKCEDSTCFQLAIITMEEFVPGEWYDITIPYNFRDWHPNDSCGAGLLIRPAIYVTNDINTVQGGEETYSYAQIDNFCLDGTTVGVNDLGPRQQIRIFPNPNTGEFTVDLSELKVVGTSLRIIGLTGQLLSEIKIENSNPLQNVDATMLPEGMYIIQIISDGRVTAASKFVKM